MSDLELARQRALARQRQLRAQQAQGPQADMSFTGRLKDNIIGVDDGVMSFGEKVATGLNMAGEALTLGLVGDEAAAAADSLIGRGTYEERLAKYRADEEQLREENPVAALGAEMAPALIPGVGAMGAASRVASVGGRTAAAAALGAGSGAVYGFAEGEGGVTERLKDAGWTAVAGGVFGGLSRPLMDGIANLPRKVGSVFQKAVERPTVQMQKAARDVAYKAVDESGFAFSGEQMGALSRAVRETLEAGSYVEETDNALKATLKLLDNRAGKPTTLTQLDSIRKNLWDRYASAKDQPQILDAIAAIDHMVSKVGEADDLMKAARAANARYAKSKLFEDAFEKAVDSTESAGSGGNIGNRYKQAVRAILHNDRKNRFFSQAEKDVMRQFIRMDEKGMQRLRRVVGKLSPNGNGLMLALHTIGGVTTGGATLPAMAVGYVAKEGADKKVLKAAEELKDYFAGMPPLAQIELNPAPLAVGSAPLANDAQAGAREMLAPGQ